MYDMHSHILPGIDDGADSWDEAVAMAQIAEQDGTRVLVATSHFYEEVWPNSPERIIDLTRELGEKLEEEGVSIRVIPAMEVYITRKLADLYKDQRLLTINDNKRYLLVELPTQEFPTYTEQVLFQLQVLGVTPIIAHPERNPEVFTRPERLEAMVERGILVQINAGSLLGNNGREVQKFTEMLMHDNLVHLLGSDAHGSEKRRPLVHKAIKRIEAILPQDKANAIVIENPRKVIAGEDVEVLRPKYTQRSRKKGFLGLW